MSIIQYYVPKVENSNGAFVSNLKYLSNKEIYYYNKNYFRTHYLDTGVAFIIGSVIYY